MLVAKTSVEKMTAAVPCGLEKAKSFRRKIVAQTIVASVFPHETRAAVARLGYREGISDGREFKTPENNKRA